MNDDEAFQDPLQRRSGSGWQIPDRVAVDDVPLYWLLPRELPPHDGPPCDELPGEIASLEKMLGELPSDEWLPETVAGDVVSDPWPLDGELLDDVLDSDLATDHMPPSFWDSGGDTLHGPPTQQALNADALSALVDGIVTVNELIATAHATRALLIDQARVWSEVTAGSVVVLGPPHTDAEVHELARRSFTWELACALRIPESTASALISDSETLTNQLPATLDALAEGVISYRHAQLMVDQAVTLPAAARADFEKQVLPAAKSLTAAKFSSRARKLRERTHPESIATRRKSSFERRRMDFVPDLDGMAWINLYQPAATAVAFYNAVRAEAMTLQRDDESRTLTQLSLDVAVDHLLGSVQETLPLGAAPRLECGCPAPPDDVRAKAVAGEDEDAHAEAGAGAGSRVDDGADVWSDVAAAAGAEKGAGRAGKRRRHRKERRGRILRGIRPTVIVTVPVLTLLGSSDEPAELEGYGPIDPETARELAGEATSFMRLLVHPETGVPLSLGREKYKIPKDLRLALELRDGTCRGYGCNRPATECDIDHTVGWQFSGRSDYVNLASMCRPHHRLKHQTAWSVKQTGGGFLEWTSPLKRTYVTAPETVLPLWPPATDGGDEGASDAPPF